MTNPELRQELLKLADWHDAYLKDEPPQDIMQSVIVWHEEQAALLRLAAERIPEDGLIGISHELLLFLHGAGMLDGVWYGDKPPHERGQYWWRKRLPVLSPARPEDK